MAIDTLARRESALIDPWGMLTPDGTIGTPDRLSLLGQYSGIAAAAPETPASSESTSSEVRLYDSAGRRKYLPDTWIVGMHCELSERGGYGIGSLEIQATWEEMRALGITGTEYADLYLYGVRIYRGRVRHPEWSIDNPERGSLNMVGLIESLDRYQVRARYAYSTQVDLSIVFERLLQDWAVKAGRLPNLIVTVEPIGATLQQFDAHGKSLAQALNMLCDLAPNQCVWGCDVTDSGQDRAYLRVRSENRAYQYAVGGNVAAFAYPSDTGEVVNRLYILGGSASQPNLIENGSWEDPQPGSETVGNLLDEYSFEVGAPWTLSGGATIQDSGSANVELVAARTGDKLLELDTPGEEANQTVAIDYSVSYVVCCWARRESQANACDLTITAQGLDVGNSPVAGAVSTAVFHPPGIAWVRYKLDPVDFSAYPTVTQMQVRFLTSLGSEGATGTLIDDAGLWERNSAAQAGWTWRLNGSATRLAMDWQYSTILVYHGGYVLRVQSGACPSFPSDSLEIYQSQTSRVKVKPGQQYALGVWSQTKALGSVNLRLGARVYRSDGTLDATQDSGTILSGNSQWALSQLSFTVSSNAAEAEVFIKVDGGPALYLDAVMFVEGDLPSEYVSGKTYWEGETYEAMMDTASSGLAGLSAGAAASQATYGIREAEEAQEGVTDWETASAYAVGYFNAKAVPSIQASLMVPAKEAGELLGFAGTVKLLNLPSAPDALFPSHVRYDIGDSVVMTADLGNDRPTMAKLFRLLGKR